MSCMSWLETDTVDIGQDSFLPRRIGFAEAVQPAPQPEGAAPNHRVRNSSSHPWESNVSSDKDTKSYGKSPSLVGQSTNSTINGAIFNG